mmetsp:Transcript_11377/g.25947  ORF Transcript_11377/g.25947 Transcript_11377/m.25947 type:complete len:98 (-) Transcript_11377:4328-4621(-)|eukprot:764529-Hanusia_phi.AAC.4
MWRQSSRLLVLFGRVEVPAGQGAQIAKDPSEKLPSAQAEQEVEPSGAADPAWQFSQEVEAFEALKVPAGQSWQEELAFELEKYPGEHWSSAADPSGQ